MRGDQLVRQPRIIRAIEASPNGLNAAEIAKREETGTRTICRHLEAFQAPGFPLYTEGVRRRHPEYDERQVKLATIRLTLPEDLLLAAYPEGRDIRP